MSIAFLLRFREKYPDADSRTTSRGTGTHTKIQKEQADHVFGAAAAGTRTITEVGREASDLDSAALRPFYIVP